MSFSLAYMDLTRDQEMVQIKEEMRVLKMHKEEVLHEVLVGEWKEISQKRQWNQHVYSLTMWYILRAEACIVERPLLRRLVGAIHCIQETLLGAIEFNRSHDEGWRYGMIHTVTECCGITHVSTRIENVCILCFVCFVLGFDCLSRRVLTWKRMDLHYSDSCIS